MSTNIDLSNFSDADQEKTSFVYKVQFALINGCSIRDFPDHAIFREMGANTGLVRHTQRLPLFGPLLLGKL